jgi:hypothetical protein
MLSVRAYITTSIARTVAGVLAFAIQSEVICAQTGPMYHIYDLGILPDGRWPKASGMNIEGQVVI